MLTPEDAGKLFNALRLLYGEDDDPTWEQLEQEEQADKLALQENLNRKEEWIS